MAAMFHALLICSDTDCAEVFDAYGTLEELEALACDCYDIDKKEIADLDDELSRARDQ